MEREIDMTKVVLAQLFSDFHNRKENCSEIQQLFTYPLTGAEQTQRKSPFIYLQRLIVKLSVRAQNRISIFKFIMNINTGAGITSFFYIKLLLELFLRKFN